MAEAGFGWLVAEAELAPSAIAVAVACVGGGGGSMYRTASASAAAAAAAAAAAGAAVLLPEPVVRARFMRVSGTNRIQRMYFNRQRHFDGKERCVSIFCIYTIPGNYSF